MYPFNARATVLNQPKNNQAYATLQNEYDSGNPFYLDTEKGCNNEDACRCANELVVHELTESKK